MVSSRSAVGVAVLVVASLAVGGAAEATVKLPSAVKVCEGHSGTLSLYTNGKCVKGLIAGHPLGTGPAGAVGPAGAPGATGATGAAGAQGAAGTKGQTGATGPSDVYSAARTDLNPVNTPGPGYATVVTLSGVPAGTYLVTQSIDFSTGVGSPSAT